MGGDDLPGPAVADRDVEGAEGDGDLAARAGGAGRSAARPADRDRSPLVAPPGLPPRARERRRRQRRGRLPVLSEQLGPGRSEPAAALALAQAEAVLERPAVERAGVVERRDGDEQVPPVAADLVLDVALLVARAVVGEGAAEPAASREAAEEPRCPRLPADAPNDLGGVVEDRPLSSLPKCRLSTCQNVGFYAIKFIRGNVTKANTYL